MLKIFDANRDRELLNDFISNLSIRTFNQGNDVAETVASIIENVKENGDKAVIEYTRKFDCPLYTEEDMQVKEEEISKAYDMIDRELLGVIRRAKSNIEKFHVSQVEKSWFSAGEDGTILGQMINPIEVVGVYVPGGTAPLISSVLMNIVPAKVAGVRKIIMATPPDKNGKVNPAILVAAREAGADEIYRIGGAQAIAAMAFGTGTVPKVDKIAGPGNIYVSTAKRLVYGYCDIDMFAGPSEITVIADETAKPEFVAADLLSQAEHDALASAILITVVPEMAEKVKKEVERQYLQLERKDIIKRALDEYGAIIIAENIEQAVFLANRIAPEHLELCVKEPFGLLGYIKNAGAVFLGNYSSEPAGDYYAGPSHVLPTTGTARFFSPLNVSDFLKKTSVISYSRQALHRDKDDIIRFAEAEKLSAHANAIRVRFGGSKDREEKFGKDKDSGGDENI